MGITALVLLPALLPSAATPLQVAHGRYVELVHPGEPVQLLVVLHGALSDPDDAAAAAESLVDRFAQVAAEQHWIVVAPVFDDANFGSVAGPGGGYRGLFGREVGADVLIDEVVAAARKGRRTLPPRPLFYGHSAGGQCALRYLVRHPERVGAVVATSSASFAFPDAAVPWPDGAGRLFARMPWPGLRKAPVVDVKPDQQTFVEATQVPTAVLVGRDDDMPIPDQGGARPETRLGRASAWVDAMNSLALASGRTGKARFVAVPGKHSSPEMHEKAVRYLVRP